MGINFNHRYWQIRNLNAAFKVSSRTSSGLNTKSTQKPNHRTMIASFACEISVSAASKKDMMWKVASAGDIWTITRVRFPKMAGETLRFKSGRNSHSHLNAGVFSTKKSYIGAEPIINQSNPCRRKSVAEQILNATVYYVYINIHPLDKQISAWFVYLWICYSGLGRMMCKHLSFSHTLASVGMIYDDKSINGSSLTWFVER